MSHAIRRSPPRRAKTLSLRETSGDGTPRLLSAEEKHELILAHAEHHRSRSQPWGAGYAVALVASCLVVALGWFTTLDTNLRSGISHEPRTPWTGAKNHLQEMKQDWQSRARAGTESVQQIRQQYASARRAAQTSSVTSSTPIHP